MSAKRNHLAGLELHLVVVLGRAVMRVQDALRITAGTLIELDRLEGESADVVVRGIVVARGEVVSVGGAYGLRIRHVVSRAERLALQSMPASSRSGLR